MNNDKKMPPLDYFDEKRAKKKDSKKTFRKFISRKMGRKR